MVLKSLHLPHNFPVRYNQLGQQYQPWQPAQAPIRQQPVQYARLDAPNYGAQAAQGQVNYFWPIIEISTKT